MRAPRGVWEGGALTRDPAKACCHCRVSVSLCGRGKRRPSRLGGDARLVDGAGMRCDQSGTKDGACGHGHGMAMGVGVGWEWVGRVVWDPAR